MAEQSPAEKRAYAKGYAAGKRFRTEQRSAEVRDRAERRFKQQVFAAALQGLLVNANWETGGKKWRYIPEYVSGAWSFADEAVKQRRGIIT